MSSNYNRQSAGTGGNAQEIPPTRKNILTALSFVSPDLPRDEWKNILFAVNDALGEDGRDLAEDWSKGGQSYKAADFRDTWKSARPGKGVTVATLWRVALDAGWKPDGEAHQETEAERLAREQKQQKDRREAEQKAERERKQAVTKTGKLWKAATDLRADQGYFHRKLPGIAPPSTLREITLEQAAKILGYHPQGKGGPLEGRLIVAPFKAGDKFTTAELIDEQGRKASLAGAGTKPPGCHWAAQPLLEGDGAGLLWIVGEGVATVLTGRAATEGNAMAVAAGSDANLPPVAKLMKERFPKARGLILGDLGNGQKYAEQAARENAAALAVPAFDTVQMETYQEQHGKPPSDFNDLAALAGLSAVAVQLGAALAGVSTEVPADPAPKPEPNEKPLIYRDGKKARLVKQSLAAKVLAKKIDDLTYDPVRGCCLQFRGGVWKVVSDTLALGSIMDAIDRNGGDDVGYDSTYATGIFTFLKARLCADGFDENPDLIPFRNGVLDRRTGKLSAHDRAHRLTWQLPYDYMPGATCAPVIEWLTESVGGDLDQVEVLRAFIRAVLMGRADLQRYLEIQGPPGSGKGTLLRLFTAVVGERNTHATTMKQLETNRFETANLYKKRLVMLTDAEKYVGNTAIFQAMTGEDQLPFEAKHRQGGEGFKFGGLVVIAANDATVTGDYTGAVHRRRITIRFDHVVDATKRRRLDEEFAPFIPGVINWALNMDEGRMVDLLRDTDRQVEALAHANLMNLLEVNPVAAWAAERLVAAPGHETNVGAKREVTVTEPSDMSGRRESRRVLENVDSWLYANYADWCLENGRNDLGLKKFSNALQSAIRDQFKLDGITLLDNNNGKGKRFQGLRLRTAADIGKASIVPFFQYESVWIKNGCSTDRSLESIDSTDNAEINIDMENLAGSSPGQKINEEKSKEKSAETRSTHTVGTFNDLAVLNPCCTRTDTHADGRGGIDAGNDREVL